MALRAAFSTISLMRMKAERAEGMDVHLIPWMMISQAVLLAKMLLDRSFSSKWMKRDEQGSDEWELSESPKHFYVKDKKPAYAIQFSDVETMKEHFAKLLLGEDITGGRKGVSTALALSNAITNLAGVFV